MATDQIFKALGDPVRLKIVERLSSGSPHTIGSLTENLNISRQGARKQMQVLESAGIIYFKPSGREVRVGLDIAKLEKGKAFIANLEMQWDRRLQKLKEISEEGS